MSKYLVKLKPIETFFFGGERVLNFYKDELKNNIVKSREFPQQTSILGMIRKEILVLNGLIKEKWDYSSKEKEQIENLIGKKSFNIRDKNQDFGIIKKISPVFIIEEKENRDRVLIKIPKDHKKSKDSSQYTPFKFNNDKGDCLSVKTNLSEKNIYLPIDFESKIGLSEDFIDIQTGEIITQDEIFMKDSSIGIKLDEKHMTQDECLFRVEKYKFKYGKGSKYFAFILDVNENFEKLKKFKDYRNVVSLGGEGSYFLISFKEINFEDKGNGSFNIEEKMTFMNKINLDTKYEKKIILLSDTFIPKNIYEKYCNYSISKRIDFRNLSSDEYHNNKNEDYYKRFKRSTNKYSFLEKGSVLFSNKREYDELVKTISNSKFQNIGYNIFL